MFNATFITPGLRNYSYATPICQKTKTLPHKSFIYALNNWGGYPKIKNEKDPVETMPDQQDIILIT